MQQREEQHERAQINCMLIRIEKIKNLTLSKLMCSDRNKGGWRKTWSSQLSVLQHKSILSWRRLTC